MSTVDLYLGSDLGKWLLDNVDVCSVGQVIAVDKVVLESAVKRGMRAVVATPADAPPPSSQIALSVHYPRIFPSDFLRRYRKVYNLHPGYLPWGRGYYPVFWAIWEQTPAGATLHEISPGIDEGPIVAQVRASFDDGDTGWSLFEKVRNIERRIFLDYWPRMVNNEDLPATPQVGSGTYHLRKEFSELKRLEIQRTDIDGAALVRLARAFTFPGYKGLEVVSGRTRFELVLKPEGKIEGPCPEA